MNSLKENAQEILNLYNYFNAAIIFDENGIVIYYYNNRKDLNPLESEEIIGMHLFDAYPKLNPEESFVIKALKEGKASHDELQYITSYKGFTVKTLNTTIPVYDNNKIIGAVEVSKYIEEDKDEINNISITKLKENENRLYTLDDLKSTWEGMSHIKNIIKKVAKTDSSVLIYGKTGTGKEVVAEAIHSESERRNGMFITQNCAAIPPNLLESILFGTIKGSFTGAENKKGLLEAANGGTLFLDEINTMGISTQSKILKAIEEQKIVRVGDVNPIDINVRVIAASNYDPWQLVNEGLMRQDLYYRLKVVQINLPELKERKGDIKYLTDYFIKVYNKVMGKNILGVTEEVETIFNNYSWPGNIRELKNTIEGCFNFTNGPLIQVKDISWYKSNETKNPVDNIELNGTLKEMVQDYEKALIKATIKQQGNMSKVADCLGITRQSLNNKLKKYKLNDTKFE